MLNWNWDYREVFWLPITRINNSSKLVVGAAYIEMGFLLCPDSIVVFIVWVTGSLPISVAACLPDANSHLWYSTCPVLSVHSPVCCVRHTHAQYDQHLVIHLLFQPRNWRSFREKITILDKKQWSLGIKRRYFNFNGQPRPLSVNAWSTHMRWSIRVLDDHELINKSSGLAMCRPIRGGSESRAIHPSGVTVACNKINIITGLLVREQCFEWTQF